MSKKSSGSGSGPKDGDRENQSFPKPHILWSYFQRGMTVMDGLSELIDNAISEGSGNANQVIINIRPDRITVYDDGDGVSDINKITTLGDSGSMAVKNNIGWFGVGAKDALLGFGGEVVVETIHDGRFHRNAVDFLMLAKRNTVWNPPYTGDGKPASDAPRSMGSRGTLLTVKKLHKGRSQVNYHVMCRRLAHRYLTALRDHGKEIVVTANGVDHRLSDYTRRIMEEISKVDREEFSGSVQRRGFSGFASMAKTISQETTGLHVAFGHRFVRRFTKIGSVTLPGQFYGEVRLDVAWKDCLSADKTKIVRYQDDLMTAIHGELKDWISLLEEAQEMGRTAHLEGLLSQELAKILAFRPDTEGEYRKGPQQKNTTHEHPNNGPPPREPDADNVINLAEHGGAEGAREMKKRRSGQINFRMVPDLGKEAFVVDEEAHGLNVWLNGKIKPIEKAWGYPFETEALWPVVVAALVDLASRDPETFIRRHLPDCVERIGANIGDDDFYPALFGYLLSAQPDIKEPSKEEVAV